MERRGKGEDGRGERGQGRERGEDMIYSSHYNYY